MRLTESKLRQMIREENEKIEAEMMAEIDIMQLVSKGAGLVDFLKPLKTAWEKAVEFKKKHPEAWEDFVGILTALKDELAGITKDDSKATEKSS